MVDVDGSCQFPVDSQPKSIGLVWALVATWHSVCIHQMNRVNSLNDFGHGDGTMNIVVVIIRGGSVAKWLACWTPAQKGPGSNCSRNVVG